MVTTKKDKGDSGFDNGPKKRLKKIIELLNQQESRIDHIEQEV